VGARARVEAPVATLSTSNDHRDCERQRFDHERVCARRGGYDLVVPDLSGVAGFDPRWGLHANQPVFWSATRIGGSLGLGVNAQPFPGATSRTGERSGTVNDDQRARQP
jgi:hypothetical protein